ncbi:hypothetical protein BHE74_00002727 [Ensete ventricosum]|nr:hypothetical protein BHE74_00002727 [Ensete ventricosum]
MWWHFSPWIHFGASGCGFVGTSAWLHLGRRRPAKPARSTADKSRWVWCTPTWYRRRPVGLGRWRASHRFREVEHRFDHQQAQLVYYPVLFFANMSFCSLYPALLVTSPWSCSENHLGSCRKQLMFCVSRRKARRGAWTGVSCSAETRTVVIGLAADSGCGKSTFMRRLTSVLGGVAEPPRGCNAYSNTLVGDATTVICLDDYHALDREERKEKGVTALDPKANNFDLMYEQVRALKSGVAVEKPVYNHVTGRLDPPELIRPPNILFIEGLHPL